MSNGVFLFNISHGIFEVQCTEKKKKNRRICYVSIETDSHRRAFNANKTASFFDQFEMSTPLSPTENCPVVIRRVPFAYGLRIGMPDADAIVCLACGAKEKRAFHALKKTACDSGQSMELEKRVKPI